MNKFAQLLYGKVIYIYETELTKDKLSTVFDPSTFWVDITGMSVSVGDIASFDQNVGIVFTTPEEISEKTLDDYKNEKLEELNNNVSKAITNGFVMKYNDNYYLFDSDIHDQINAILFINNSTKEKIQVRGYLLNDDTYEMYDSDGTDISLNAYASAEDKTILELSKEDMQNYLNILNDHIMFYKKIGWEIQKEIKQCTNLDELIKVDLNVNRV